MHLDGITVPEPAFTDLLRKYHVKELSLFGSRARGDNRPDSDVDLLVEYLPDSHTSLIEFSSLKLDLEELFGIKVDLVSKGGLKPRIRDNVLNDARIIYAL